MVEGVHTAVYTSIKPGCFHRLSLDPDARLLVSNVISSMEHLYRVCEYGENVRKGEVAYSPNLLATLIAKALRESYRWCTRVYPSLIIPQMILSFTLSHSNVDSVLKNSASFKKSLDLVLDSGKWGEIKQVIDVFKSIDRNDMYEHLVSTGVSQLAGISGYFKLRDVFRVLGSKWVSFTLLDTYEFKLINEVKKLIEYSSKYRSLENAVVALYLDSIKGRIPVNLQDQVDLAFEKGLISTRDGVKILYELDQSLRKTGLKFNEYGEYLAVVTSIAIFEGTSLQPKTSHQ